MDIKSALKRQKEYRLPKNYSRWSSFLQDLSYGLEVCKTVTMRDLSREDVPSYLISYALSHWYLNYFPLYCISTEMMREFEGTEVLGREDIVKDIDGPSFLLFLPDNSLLSPEGNPIPYILVTVCTGSMGGSYSRLGESSILLERISARAGKNISWTLRDSKGNTWFSGHDIGLGKLQIITNTKSQTELDFLVKVTNLVTQCLLVVNYSKSLVEDNYVPEVGLSKVSSLKPKSPSYLYPRWIGRTYKVSSRKRSSPTSHTRRAHWKRVRVGKNREQYKWVRIEETEVNALSAV